MSSLLDALMRCLPPRGQLLDLGCGAGVPISQSFAHAGWDLVGVDICPQMLALAGREVPSMLRVQGEMQRVQFAPECFDAVTAVYSLFHVPCDEQPLLFESIARWLRPGGRLFFTYATADYTGQAEFEGWIEFMGTRLFYGHTSIDRLRSQLAQAGLEVEAQQQPLIGGERFLWITARKG